MLIAAMGELYCNNFPTQCCNCSKWLIVHVYEYRGAVQQQQPRLAVRQPPLPAFTLDMFVVLLLQYYPYTSHRVLESKQRHDAMMSIVL